MLESEPARTRVLILTPSGRDAQLACSVLAHERVQTSVCGDLKHLVEELDAGAGIAIIADEALQGDVSVLTGWVRNQPAWSDFPFILLTGGPRTHERARPAIPQPFGNVTLLDRPLRSITLISVVKTALRARLRQYEVEQYIEQIRTVEAERAQAFAREEAAHAEVEVLNHVGEILSAEMSLDALLPAIVEAGTDLSRSDVGVFYSEDLVNTSGQFVLRCVSGLSMETVRSLLGPHTLLDAGAFSERRVLHCNALQNGVNGASYPLLLTISGKLSLNNCIAVPVASRRRPAVGVMVLGRLGDGPFSARDERVAASLASQAAIAIDNARLFATAENERRRLESARQVLQRSNEELRQFAYVASHDLQEPLRTVASFTQLLVRRFRGQAGPDADACVGFIVDGVERMSRLIHDLLEYSRSGIAGTLPANPVSAEEVLNEVLTALAASIAESEAAITHDPLPQVWIENRSLFLLLQNLIGNAIKYRSEALLRIHISAESAGEDWLFSVKDNGIGIAPQYHDRIFGIFKRLHGKEIPGTGIGLAICHRIVQGHGGRIWVESEPGAGSVFRFTLPKESQRMQREMAEFAALGTRLS